jgi:hypothetical protein
MQDSSAILPPASGSLLDRVWRPPSTCLPMWGVEDLPEPPTARRWSSFIGPGLVMMGIQIGGGEWLFGPEVTARFGGGLMWLATISIVLQVFYNLEVGRYALFCGEPVFTGFLRMRPGPKFWAPFFVLLSLGAIVPGMAFHAASVLAAIILDHPPRVTDRAFVLALAYACLVVSFVPVLFGGKVYNTLQTIMTVKIVGVLSFCLIIGISLVSWTHWADVILGFFNFGGLPCSNGVPGERLTNFATYRLSEGHFPTLEWADVAVIGAFIGFAGGGGLGNSLYGNFVRDKGWGMGMHVGAIPSAIGGQNIGLSHFGKIFPLTNKNLQCWSGWWRVILIDQLILWAPGCFVGMALPALLSLEFAQHSTLFMPELGPAGSSTQNKSEWANAIITADGMRHDPRFSPIVKQTLWLFGLGAGLLVLMPSQMAVVDEVSRRWTDVIWTGSKYVRQNFLEHQVKHVYYSLVALYFLWCASSLYLFGVYGTPRLMTLVIANLGNLALGVTAFQVLWINCRWLPQAIRPSWFSRLGLAMCGLFYLTITTLVFFEKQWPVLRELLL